MLEDAGLREHSVSFDAFTAQKNRGFVTKSFYSLLGLRRTDVLMCSPCHGQPGHAQPAEQLRGHRSVQCHF